VLIIPGAEADEARLGMRVTAKVVW